MSIQTDGFRASDSEDHRSFLFHILVENQIKIMEGHHTDSRITVKRFSLSDSGCFQESQWTLDGIYEPVSKAIICSGGDAIKIPVIRLICSEHELHIS